MKNFLTYNTHFLPSDSLLECIPNISEGKNPSLIDQIVSSISSMGGIQVLDVDSSPSANRTVVTFIGKKELLKKACTQFILTALELLDMRQHHGVHPRIGAVDVFPIVPYKNSSIYEAILLSKQIATSVYNTIDLPIYFYEYSSYLKTPLQDIRRGEYEYLEQKLKIFPPDLGGRFNPKTGALIIGARNPLIAYNINMSSNCDINTAKLISSLIRESGNKKQSGWIHNLKAIGWYLDDINKVQVSCNLTNYKQTPLYIVYELISSLSKLFNVHVTGSELVGLVPYQALLDTYRYYTKDYTTTNPVTILEEASSYLNLSDIKPFDIYSKSLF